MSIHKMKQKELGDRLLEFVGDQVEEIKIDLIRGDVWTRLVNREGTPVPNTAYKLYQNSELIEEGTTDGSGAFKVEDLPQGLFRIKVTTEEGYEIETEVPWLKKGTGPHLQVLRLPTLVEVSWGKKEIFPLFYPRSGDEYPDRGSPSVPLIIRTFGLPNGINGILFEIDLYGFDDDGARHELPLHLLGVEGLWDMEVRRNILTSVKEGDRPALELRLPWTEEGGVFSAELDRFQVEVTFNGPLKVSMKSVELKRTRPVLIIANPTGDLGMTNLEADCFIDGGVEMGHLVLAESGGYKYHYTGKKLPYSNSIFEFGEKRYTLPLAVATKHMRGSSHTIYQGHGSLSVDGKTDPCDSCRFRSAWDNMDIGVQIEYLSKVLRPLKFDDEKNKYVSSSWREFRRYISKGKPLKVWYDIDESGGDPNFTPRITSRRASIGKNFSQMFTCLKNGDFQGLGNSLYFCMPSQKTRFVDSAAKLHLGGYSIVDASLLPPPFTGPYLTEDRYRGYPTALNEKRNGDRLSSTSDAYIPSVEDRCQQGVSQYGKRVGYIFWQNSEGETMKKDGGKSFMIFNFNDSSENLDAEVVNGMEGQHPTPTELMFANGCLTASSSDLAESFLTKGTRVYIGNRKPVFCGWSLEFSREFAHHLFILGKSPEEVFNHLKGEYEAKMLPRMFVKKQGE